MNSSLFSFLELVCTGLMFIAVIYSIFSIFKVNYFNPIVQIFVKIIDPFTKVFLGINKSLSGLIVAIVFKLLGLLSYVSSYNYILLISISFFEVLIVFFKILFYFVIAGVIKSWVAPFSENDMWKIVEEVSNKILDPIRKFIPAIGGLDFSPVFAFILLNSINVFLAQLAISIL
jgi:YggT family protein